MVTTKVRLEREENFPRFCSESGSGSWQRQCSRSGSDNEWELEPMRHERDPGGISVALQSNPADRGTVWGIPGPET